MRVRCKAAADYRGNAAGHLELENTRDGLSITYLAVSLHREGYAPGPLTRGARVLVPWRSVYATRSGDCLLLSVDGRFTPLNRFVLHAFSRGEALQPSEARRRRRLIKLGAALALMLGLGLMWTTLPVPHMGIVTAVAAAALLILLLGVTAEQPLIAPSSARVLDEFSAELSRHLPRPIATEPALTEPKVPRVADLQALLPRSIVGMTITLTAAALAALIMAAAARSGAKMAPMAAAEPSSRTIAQQLSPEPNIGGAVGMPSSSGASRATSPAGTIAEKTAVPLGEECHCVRHDSLLWQKHLPRLTPIIVSRHDRPHGRHQHIEIELAAINDGDRSLTQLNFAVAFYEKGPDGERRTVERPLYYEGPLGPGRAIKWQVDGRGTRFEVLAPDLGTLEDDGSDAAPAEAFAALTRANHRPVRLHAAMMLTFLGDPRGRAAALELRAAELDGESSYLDRVLDATRELEVCERDVAALEQQQYRVRACVYNTTRADKTGIGVRLRSISRGIDPRSPLGDPPTVLAEDTRQLLGAIPAERGRRVSWLADLSSQSGLEPGAFELSADRSEVFE